MKVPKFATEREEADWWYEHRHELDEEMAAAIRDGRATSGKGKTMEERIAAMRAAQAIHIRISEDDLDLARKIADHKGLAYQTLIQSLLHEALEREAQVLANR